MIENIIPRSSLWIILLSLYLCSCRCPLSGDDKEIDYHEMVGEWYVVAATPIRDKVGKCLHFNVVMNGTESFAMNFTTNSSISNRRLLWRINGKQSENETIATWQLNGSPRVLGPFFHKTLAVNYTQFCAMIVCTGPKSKMYRTSFGMIWSRQRYLPTKELIYLKYEIGKYVNKQEIIDVDNTCSGISF
ncbi:uncharacterized protein LOC141533078 [Cotesia typhae]|uniref:uncharacterized protein LOC141533078 n=1 Tax=Cotesia typhae TaxID=2053667 RepID=UPI003D69F523